MDDIWRLLFCWLTYMISIYLVTLPSITSLSIHRGEALMKQSWMLANNQTVNMLSGKRLCAVYCRYRWPFSFSNKNGIAQNALVHERVIKNITADNDSIMPILPMKRSYDDEESIPCMACTRPVTTPGHDRVLTSLSYSKLIRERQYVELSSAMWKLLNQY